MGTQRVLGILRYCVKKVLTERETLVSKPEFFSKKSLPETSLVKVKGNQRVLFKKTRQVYNLFQGPLECFLWFFPRVKKGNLKGHFLNRWTRRRKNKQNWRRFVLLDTVN